MESNAPTAAMADLGTILVIEDESLPSQSLAAALTQRGFRVDIAATVGAAVACLERKAYRAIALDLMLPNDIGLKAGDVRTGEVSQWVGVELFKRIRQGQFAQAGTSKDVVVFIVSAVVDEKTKQMVGGFNPTDYILKPAKSSIVAERVKLFFQVGATS